MKRIVRAALEATCIMVGGVKNQKSFSRKVRYIHYLVLAAKNGVIRFRWDRIATEYVDDYLTDTGIGKKEKEWYYQRGIQTYKIQWDGLNKENYNNFISDFDFYNKSNYQNRDFECWFEHKLNTYYCLAPFKKNMPRHFYYIYSHKIYPIDVERKCNGTVNDILKLVKKQPLAAKACVGGHGKGFYKIVCQGGIYKINDDIMEEGDVEQFISTLTNYIITEYAVPHSQLQKLCGREAFAVIRVTTVYDEVDGPQLTGAMIRLGSKEAGLVTDYNGTIYCGLTLDEGRFFSPFKREGDEEKTKRRIQIVRHPDTQKTLEGIVLSNFNELKRLVLDIAAYLPITPYLCMDIVPTNQGFKLLEINSHGQVCTMEPFYPFMLNLYNRKIFEVRER